MRRIALLSLSLLVSGCEYKTWSNPPFTAGYSPNAPMIDSQNVLRAKGLAAEAEPLTPEPGDIWPGPPPPTLTMRELEQELNTGSGQRDEILGNPTRGGARGSPAPSPNPERGSSVPPGSNQPPLATMPPPTGRPYAEPHAAPPDRGPAGQVYQTKEGPAVVTGGGPGYQTMTLPGGGTGIIIPNGNGTSTIIRSDGKMETVPTPR